MSTLSLLATISDMATRLTELQQQLASLASPPTTYQTHQTHQTQPYPHVSPPYSRGHSERPRASPGFAPPGFASPSFTSPSFARPLHRGRIPYPTTSSAPIRLQHHEQQHQQYQQQQPHQHQSRVVSYPHMRTAHQDVPFQMVTLSSVLQPQEEVTIRIQLRKTEADSKDNAELVATFDGEKLVVTGCECIPTLVGVSVIKPGVILYRFMEELHAAGHLKRMFTVAPWRLCSVVRDGTEVTLEELRRQYLAKVV